MPAPLPAVEIVTGRLNVTARRKFTSSAVVVTVRVPAPPNATAPAPFCVTAPSALMFPLIFSVPAFVNVTTPLVAVVMPPAPTVMLFVVRFTPVAVFVSTNPVSVVRPVPALCTNEAAVKPALSVTSFALVIVTAPNRFVPPTAPVNNTLDPAAVTPSVWPVVLSTVPAKVTSPAPTPVPAVAMVTGPVKFALELNVTLPATVVTLPAVLIPPVPVNANALPTPLSVMSEPALITSVPPVTSASGLFCVSAAVTVMPPVLVAEPTVSKPVVETVSSSASVRPSFPPVSVPTSIA